ncbi:MAG: AAA family ATPase [Candidatus Babeliales bacterium]|nr:AAA family ATPase [Candidatus Babeliales bacterium]
MKILKKTLFIALYFSSVTIFAADLGFKSIVGNVPLEFKELCFALKNKKKNVPIKLPKGILLVGPSGIGKTSLAKALSQELKCPFIYKNATELDEVEIQKLYKEARSKAKKSQCEKAIIFIDNFHIFSTTNTGNKNNEMRSNVLALMNEMDGFNKDDLIVTIGATFRSDNFDASLVRSGRFEQIIELGFPTSETRKLMIKKFNEGSKIPIDPALNLDKITSVTYNFTPADIKHLISNSIKKANKIKAKNLNEVILLKTVIEILQTKLKVNLEKDLNLNIRIKLINELLKQKNQKKGYARIVGEVPNEIKELVQQIKDNSLFEKFKIEMPKGILLSGPSGTGKTSLVRAISEEVGCEFIAISGAEFNDQFIGSGAQKIKSLFNEAKNKAENTLSGKTIIFIDELDSLGKRNGTTLDTTITELLTQMDGFEEDNSIIVIAATNNPENIDSALLRPGRFSKIIKIGYPDLAKRKLLLNYYMKGIPLSANINIIKLANVTNNFSPADFKELVQKASSLAFTQKLQKVEERHFVEGIKAILMQRIIKGEKNIQQQIDSLEVAFNNKETKKGFNSLAGKVESEIEDLVKMIKGELNYKAFGIPFPKGILLVGPPGTGKTAVVRALAEESGCEFVQAKGSDFIEKYVGVGAQRVREMFIDARTKSEGNQFKKTIIFIDEIDCIGSRSTSDNSETQRTVTELLTQMDGFYKDESVIVIGATNSPVSLDPALLRAGRFDIIVEIPLPNSEKRTALFNYYCKDKPLDKNISFEEYVKVMEGCNAADIKNLIDKAAKIAMKLKDNKIRNEHINQAIEEVKTASGKKGLAYA